jgi:hypothetical protein
VLLNLDDQASSPQTDPDTGSRATDPCEVAGSSFLASDESSCASGAGIMMDGGVATCSITRIGQAGDSPARMRRALWLPRFSFC